MVFFCISLIQKHSVYHESYPIMPDKQPMFFKGKTTYTHSNVKVNLFWGREKKMPSNPVFAEGLIKMESSLHFFV